MTSLSPEEAQALIRSECDAIKELLIRKNAAYGNSCFAPIRVFSKASSEEQILVRVDDKLNRIARGSGVDTEDTVQDIIGYLVLLRVSRRLAARGGEPFARGGEEP